MGGRYLRAHRFIPACAGNSIYCSGASRNIGGSSPRVRGTDGLIMAIDGRGRFIPACAGNSIINEHISAAVAVHPRVCGEQCRILIGQVISDGSSPRVRGTEPVAVRLIRLIRFIPACAGNRNR